jgi:hypothetical protein
MPDHPMRTPARPATDAEALERGEAMFALDQEVRRGIAEGRKAMWATARALEKMDLVAGWSALGYDSLNEYLAELGISARTFRRSVRAVRELDRRKVSPARFDELDVTKVDLVLGAVTEGQVKMKEALDDAEALGWRDLREKYLGGAASAGQPGGDDGDGVINGTGTELDPVDSAPAAAPDSNDLPEKAPVGQRPAVKAEMDWHERVVQFLLDLKAKAGDPEKKRLPKSLIEELDALLGNG